MRHLSDVEFILVYDKFIKTCDTCKTVKPPRTHHCSQCNRCVVRMDHHCVWIGNCVGLHNMKPFLLFLVYGTITCFYSFILGVVQFHRCTPFFTEDLCRKDDFPEDNTLLVSLDNANKILCSIALFASIFKGLFTLAIFVAQLLRISQDLTYIDKMQIAERLNHFQFEKQILDRISHNMSASAEYSQPEQSRSVSRNIRQYMGGQNGCTCKWLAPVKARTQSNLVIEQELCIDYLRHMGDFYTERTRTTTTGYTQSVHPHTSISGNSDHMELEEEE